MKTFFFTTIFFLMEMNLLAQVKHDAWLERLIRDKASPQLLNVLNQPDSFRYQIIYTKIDRDKNNNPSFTNYYLNVDESRYFNPASMVKLPTALAALEKINTLKSRGIDKYTPMFTDSSFSGQTEVQADSTSANRVPSIEHYIKKNIFS